MEFLADRAVVHSGFDRKNYQYHLLRLSYGVNIGQIVNNFNVSPLKKRIMMMNKKKSRHAGALKYALLLPVAGLLVLSANAEAVAETAENVVAHWTADEGPVRMTGVVVDENGKPLPGVTVVIKGSMLGVATDAEGRFEIVSPEDKTLVFTYVGRKTQEVAFDGGTTDIKVVMPVEDVELNPLVAADVESILNQAADSTKDEVVSVWQDEFFKVVEDMPQFTDGNIFDYLAQHVRYPEEAEKNGIGGMVYVQFVIDTAGNVVEPKVIRGVSPELDAEALRVVSEMPAWKPGMQRGKPVRVSFTLPVIFKLPTPEGAAPDDKVQVSTMVADSICIMGNSVTGSGNPKGQAYECMLSELRSKIKETPLIFVGTQQQEAGFDLASLDPQMVEHVMLCWGTRVTYMDGQKLDNQTVVLVKMKEGK